jgi:DNA topoisomerase II
MSKKTLRTTVIKEPEDAGAGGFAAPETHSRSEMTSYNVREHILHQSMWTGAKEKTGIPGLLGVYWDGKSHCIRSITNQHSPALLKSPDELLVNVADHACETRSERGLNKLTNMVVTFDAATGYIEVFNNGRGLPVSKNSAGDYIPYIAFFVPMTGTNLQGKRASRTTKGGINGAGCKIASIGALNSVLCTCDGNQVYVQVSSDNMAVVDDPIIFPCKDAKKSLPDFVTMRDERATPHTSLRFQPDYARFGYSMPPTAEEAAEIEAWLHYRCCQISAYLGNVTVEFQGRPIAFPDTPSLAVANARSAMRDPTADPTVYSVVFKGILAKAHKLPSGDVIAAGESLPPWCATVCVSPEIRSFSIATTVNGTNTADGPHKKHIKEILRGEIQKKYRTASGNKKKELSLAEATKNISMYLTMVIPEPSWDGQSKDKLQVAKALIENHTLPKATLGKIATDAAAHLMSVDVAAPKQQRKKHIEKYTPPGNKRLPKCELKLAVIEGDSANNYVKITLSCGNPYMNNLNTGTYCLGGVIMNGLRECVTNVLGKLLPKDKFRDSEKIAGLIASIGLRFEFTYTTQAELDTLEVGEVIAITDQDTDGTGKILALLMVIFFVYWPELLRRGFLKHVMTPVICAWPKRGKDKPRLYYYDHEFEQDVAQSGGLQVYMSQWRPEYYKGLAAHEEDHVKEMAKTIHEHVYTFTYEDAARWIEDAPPESDAYYFYALFGKESDGRKDLLSNPIEWPSAEEKATILRTKRKSCAQHLKRDCIAYKQDAILRQIPGAFDGLKPSSRKVVAGMIQAHRAGKGGNKKVFQIGGYVASEMFYHHGDASLQGTIIKMAQRCLPGGQVYPLLIGKGLLGSKAMGGKDAGSARYVGAILAAKFVNTLNPPVDRFLFKPRIEDGVEAEPVNYVFVLPPVFLTGELVSEGWKHISYARDFDAVCKVVERMLSDTAIGRRLRDLSAEVCEWFAAPNPGGEMSESLMSRITNTSWFHAPLPSNTERFNGTCHTSLSADGNIHEHSTGSYIHDKVNDKIIITELPMWTATDPYHKKLVNPKVVRKVNKKDTEFPNPAHDYLCDFVDMSPSDGVRLEYTLRRGGLDAIVADHGSVEAFFGLRKNITPILNYLREDGVLLEFGTSYLAVILYWFGERAAVYKRRAQRDIAIATLRAEYERHRLRFALESDTIGIHEIEDEDVATERLRTEGYTAFSRKYVTEPRYTPVHLLDQIARDPENGASYDYLLDMPARDRLQKNVDKIRAKVAGYEAEIERNHALLAEAPVSCASQWLAEIDEVRSAVDHGRRTNWKFD